MTVHRWLKDCLSRADLWHYPVLVPLAPNGNGCLDDYQQRGEKLKDNECSFDLISAREDQPYDIWICHFKPENLVRQQAA
jgi:hypothetical protein